MNGEGWEAREGLIISNFLDFKTALDALDHDIAE